MITALVFIALAGAQQDAAKPTPITCAILGGNAAVTGPAVDYKGVHYPFCCTMCQGAFMKDPDKAISADRNKGKTIGVFLFDPVSGARIGDAQSKAFSDYNGVRYEFTSDDEKKTFDGSPAKYAAYPEKEALFCPVQKTKLSGYAAAGSFRDYNGVRYYFCCNSCPTDFMKSPGDYVKNASDYVMDPKALAIAAAATPSSGQGAAAAPAFTPVSFNCKHCGKPVTINSAEEAAATCSVCGCGKKCSECNPGG